MYRLHCRPDLPLNNVSAPTLVQKTSARLLQLSKIQSCVKIDARQFTIASMFYTITQLIDEKIGRILDSKNIR